jgi:hypothetical protein
LVRILFGACLGEIAKRQFNLQVQQPHSFSLRRSEMFIATSRASKDLRSVRSETRQRSLGEAGKAIALLRSFGVKKDRRAINISPLWGEATTQIFVALQVNRQEQRSK